MNVAFVASEGVPFSKTGGLADVVGALPRALASLGHQVSVFLPRYRQTKLSDHPAFRDVGTVFTIHNMGYQGLFPPDTLPLLMLPWDLFTMSKMEFFGQVNFLKGALTYSDYITTVSRKYSQEIQTAEYGFGLEGVLRDRASTVTGILNGVDYDEWSPQTDKFSAAKYSPQDLSGKAKCKQDLLAAFGVKNADPKLPVIGIVSRFAAQKGFDLISQIADRLAREDMIIVALGAVPQQDCRQGRLRQRDRPQDRSRRRHVPHAVTLRALRPQSDLQPEIWHCSHRPGHRRSRRHHRTLGRPHREGNWLQVHRIQRRIAPAHYQASTDGLSRPNILAGANAQRHE